jgi:ribonuclease III
VDGTLAELKQALGHCFHRPELLVCALTHRSLANEIKANDHGHNLQADVSAREDPPRPIHNERLEFLGDAVLGLVVAEAMFEAHPEWQEGELTRVRAQLVSRKHLAEVAMAIGLGNYLRLSRGEERGGLRNKSTVLSNTMEAVLGAMFLDAGLEPVRAFARKNVLGRAAEQLAEEIRSGDALGNYKSALQEYAQAGHIGTPFYRVASESGPDHRKRFIVEVRFRAENGMAGEPLAHGHGNTKKLAEQDAARRALESLKAASIGDSRPITEWEEQAAE